MTNFVNHDAVSNQAGIQIINGPVTFNDTGTSSKRARYYSGEADANRILDDDILTSLAFPQMFNRRSNIETAHPNTCEWLSHLDSYRNWRDQSRSLLWIKGKPGSGKSTLISHLYSSLVLHQLDDRQIGLEFFFNARGTHLQRHFVGMLRSLLSQIFYRDPDTRRHLRDAYSEKYAHFDSTSSVPWELSELRDLFMSTVLASAQHRQIIILVDALDEAGEEAARTIADYFHHMNDLVTASAGRVKICISCRHYPISSSVKAVEIHVENHNHHDIALFIRDKINHSVDPSRQDLDAITRDLIIKANGVFQWVRLMIPKITKWLDDGQTTEQILTRLTDVPKDLEAVYENILTEVIDRGYRNDTLRLFQWVCLARRPLSITEARYALSTAGIETGTVPVRCHEVENFEPSNSIMCRRVVAWSGGLLEVIPSKGFYYSDHAQTGPIDVPSRNDPELLIQVIHQSVNDFMSERGLSLLLALSDGWPETKSPSSTDAVSMSHSSLYLSCLKYLATESPVTHDLDSVHWSSSWRQMSRVVETHSLLKYSASSVFFHATQSGDCRVFDFDVETRLLSRSSPILAALANDPALGCAGPVLPGMTVLHLAAIAGLVPLAGHRLRSSDELNQQDSTGWTPVHVAVHLGHLMMVEVLYTHGADMFGETLTGHTPLLLAARYGHRDIFAFLLDHGVDVNTTNSRSRSALFEAAHYGHAEICRMCIAAGANVNPHNKKIASALEAAVSSGTPETVSILLEAGANMGERFHDNTILLAAYYSRKQMINFLLGAAADLGIEEVLYGTALHSAALKGWKNAVRYLLNAGASVNASEDTFSTALVAALRSPNSNDGIVEMLRAAIGESPQYPSDDEGSIVSGTYHAYNDYVFDDGSGAVFNRTTEEDIDMAAPPEVPLDDIADTSDSVDHTAKEEDIEMTGMDEEVLAKDDDAAVIDDATTAGQSWLLRLLRRLIP